MEIGKWTVWGTGRDELSAFYSRMGAPPPIRGTRDRADHGDAYGWLFRTVDSRLWHNTRKMPLRSEPLDIVSAEGAILETIPPPLFSKLCEWKAERDRDRRYSERPLKTTATLDISINPTLFARHQSITRPRPENLQHQALPQAPLREASFNREDNWLPQSGRLLNRIRLEGWRPLLDRYLAAIEDGFESEVRRSCEPGSMPSQRSSPHFNVKVVETYWEWLSEDPLKVVHDLWGPLRSYSRRFRMRRTYNVECTSEDDRDMHVIHVEHSPGETLKVYAKTNQRIRIEVSHKLVGENSFRFPGVRDDEGRLTRSGRHVLTTRSGVHTLLERLRERAATVVNEALRHLDRSLVIPTNHIAAYYFIGAVTHAIHNWGIASEILSALVNRGSISLDGHDDEMDAALRGLEQRNILTPLRRRGNYVVARPYWNALRQIQLSGNASVLIGRPTTQ